MSVQSNKWSVVKGKNGSKNTNTRRTADNKSNVTTRHNVSLDQITPNDLLSVNQKSMGGIKELIATTVNSEDPGNRLSMLLSAAQESLRMISTILKEKGGELEAIDDNQKKVIFINGIIPVIEEGFVKIERSLSDIGHTKEHFVSTKDKSLTEISVFLKNCGLTIPIDEKKPTESNKATYADIIGSINSSLVVKKQKKPVNHAMVTVGGVKMVNSNSQNAPELTLYFDKTVNRTCIKMLGSPYTVGSVIFIDGKNGVKNIHSCRCSTNFCTFVNNGCRYYHDPLANPLTGSDHRAFVLDYVKNQMLGKIKNDDDIANNKSIRSQNFVRDLEQLAGAIMFRAAQIKTQYLQYLV
jgi:hypothetical protein